MRAGARGGAGLGSLPPTGLAGGQTGDGDGLLATEGGLLEADLERVAQVLAPARPAAPTPTAPRSEEVAEEVADDVLEAGTDVEPAETPLLEGGVSEAIIETAPLGVGENLVRLDQLLEALLGFGPVLGILVGMVAKGELPIRLLDFVVGRGARDPEHLVVVALHETRGALTPGRRVRAPLPSGPRSRKRNAGAWPSP